VLIQQEIAGLWKAVEIATEVKGRKRKYIWTAKTLTVGEIANLIAEKDSSGQEEGREPAKKVHGQRRCRRCRETSYNTYTCAVEIIDASDSNESE
jgi:ribosomal protein L37E